MNLSQVKLSAKTKIKSIELKDEKLKLRLMELGLNVGTVLVLKARSFTKTTMLVNFNNSCFTMSGKIAEGIEVDYV